MVTQQLLLILPVFVRPIFQAVPLSQGYGTHYANAWVGSPTPQRKTLIVDTGSHYTGKTLLSDNLLAKRVLGFFLTTGFV